jgi:hypothetical protein
MRVIASVVLFVIAVAVIPTSLRAAPVTGMSFWLDATNVDGSNNSTLSNGSAIAQWNDLSGNSFNVGQVTSNKRPTLVTNVLNGLPVVRLDGLNDDLSDSGGPFTGNVHTIFVVLQASKPAIEQDFLDAGPAGSTSYLANYTDTNGIHIFRGAGGGDVVNTNYTNGQYLIYGAVYDGGVAGGSAITINGANTTTGTLGAIADSNTVYIGSNIGGLTSFYAGDIAEILVYNSILSPSDYAANETYLNNKWFVASSVPEPASLVTLLVVVGPVALTTRRRRSDRAVGATT